MDTTGGIKRMHQLAAVFFLWTIAGCALPPHLLLPNGQAADRSVLSAMLAAHPLPAGQNFSATLLGRTELLSYHLIQIRDRERPHLHASHDASVTLLRGSGHLYIAGQPHEMRAGDVAVIRHGMPHYFVNSGSEPAVAFAAFVPPYDGTDQVPME
jgi:quercetin dioxygenase-like cupin family protein